MFCYLLQGINNKKAAGYSETCLSTFTNTRRHMKQGYNIDTAEIDLNLTFYINNFFGV